MINKQPAIAYREVLLSDIDQLSKIRALEWGTEAYWKERITGYFNKTHHPQQALLPRVIYVADLAGVILGFVAGHLTERFGCEGELEWINVLPSHRGKGIAFDLLKLLTRWFVAQNALKICVDPDEPARKFYAKFGAVQLNAHWMGWNDIRVVLNE